MRNCKVCLGEHNDKIHEATLRVRSWFRADCQCRLKIGSSAVLMHAA